MALRHRLVVVLALVAAVAGCPAVDPLPLPGGLPLDALTPAQRALVRVTLEIEGEGTERKLTFDDDDLTIAGDFALDNVGDGGPRAALLRAYGRVDGDAAETLLGEATGSVTVVKGSSAFVDFTGSSFETCGAAIVDGACAVRFDENRNGASNIDDLVAGVDAAPQPPFLHAADTLQFPSGLRIGAVARQVVVVDNLGSHPIRIDTIRAAGGQGVGVSTYNAEEDAVPPPRRLLAATDLDDDGDGASDFVVLPGEEAFIAVSFSPANSFLTTASVQVVAVDTVTRVTQSVRTKVIANPDGALRPRDPTYVEPVDLTSLTTAGGTVRAQAFPASELFSGVEVTGVDDPDTDVKEEAQLSYTGARIRGDGFDAPADVAFVVDVPAKTRFTATLAGLVDGSDVDVTVVDVADGAAPALVGISANAGTSAEAVEFANGLTPRRVAVVLGRVERDAPPAVSGGLSADEPIPFRLTCQVTRGPELVDVEPVTPAHGALGGGITVRLRGGGFFVPVDRVAGPHVQVSFDGIPVVGVPQVTLGDDGVQTLAVVLPPGVSSAADRPVAVTVENPTSTAGVDGDGQAVTLAGGFRYDLPSPRVTSLTPDAANVAGGGVVPVTITGAFFFDTYGPPAVLFDDVAVDADFVDNATLHVQPPPHEVGDVAVTIKNRVFGGELGEASNARAFRFVEPELVPPRIDAVTPARGSADGGATVTIDGANFDGARVFFGSVAAVVTSATSSQLVVVAPPSTRSGPVDVLVQNGDGQVAVARAGFDYELPTPRIDRIFPARAPVGGGTPVIVDGAGFRVDVSVAFVDGATRLPAAAVTIVSSGRMLVTTPPFVATSTARVVVTNANGVVADGGFTFFEPAGPPPRVVAIDPSVIDVAGGDRVTITGSGLSNGDIDVIIGTETLRDVAVEDAANGLQRVTFTAPPGAAGPALVTIVNDDGQSDGTTLTYVDVGVPRLLAVSPAVVHARVSGDELLGFGENLGLLGRAVTATAIVSGEQGDERVPLAITAMSDTLARFVVDRALPAGSVRVELAGAGSSTEAPPVTAASPDVVRADTSEVTDPIVGGARLQVLLLGANLAGDRLTAVRLHDAARAFDVPCEIDVPDERVILCTMVPSQNAGSGNGPTGAVYAELTYGPGEVVDDPIESIGAKDGGGGSGGPDITGVGAGVWGDVVSLTGFGLTPGAAFEARYGDGFVSVPLAVTVTSPTTATFEARVLPPGSWTVCLAGGSCLSTFIDPPQSEIEPNDTDAQATGLLPFTSMNGAAGPGERDEFFFARGGALGGVDTVTVTVSAADCAGFTVELDELAGGAAGLLARAPGTAACAPLTLPLPSTASGLFVVRLSASAGSGAEYRVDVGTTSTSSCGDNVVDGTEQCEFADTCVDCVEVGEPNEAATEATLTDGLLPGGGVVQRWIAPKGDVDALRLPTTPTQGLLTLRRIDGLNCDGALKLVTPSGFAQPGAGQICSQAFIEVGTDGEVLVTVFGPVPVGPVPYELSYEPTGGGGGAPIVVDTVEDTVAVGDRACSLREAVATVTNGQAHADCGGGSGVRRILLPPGTLTLSSRLTLTGDIEIAGLSSFDTIVAASGGGHFEIGASNSVLPPRLADLTLTGASARAITGIDDVTVERVSIRDNPGGGIDVTGHVRAVDSVFARNTAVVGGALNAGSAEITRCNFSDNEATESGGAVFVGPGPALVSATSFTTNHAGVAGGALRVAGLLDVSGARFAENFVGPGGGTRGGAIDVDAGFEPASIKDTMFADNSALSGVGGAVSTTRGLLLQRVVFVDNAAQSFGGAIVAAAPLDVSQSILLRNHAESGGAIAVLAGGAGSLLKRSHLQDNTASLMGGGLFTQVDMTLLSTSIVANSADDGSQQGSGGGVAFTDGAAMTASYVTIAYNSARLSGGGALLTSTAFANQVKDSILAPNVANLDDAGHDCAAASSPTTVAIRGTVAVAAVDGCVLDQTAGGAVVAADAGLRIVENSTEITTSEQPVDDAMRALSQAAPRISTVILPADNAHVGSCLDVAGAFVPVTDVAGFARPTRNCTIGATEVRAETTTTITVDSALDDGVGCTLRNALVSARDNASNTCVPGGPGVDRIVFAPDVGPQINLVGQGSLTVEGDEIVVDGVTGRETAPPLEIVGAGSQRVFDVRLAEGLPPPAVSVRFRGVRLVGSANGGPGHVLKVSRGSVLLEDTTVVGATGTSTGSAIDVAGGVRSMVTLQRSTLDAGDLPSDATGVLVEPGGRLFARRSTASSSTARLIAVQNSAVAFLEQSTLAVVESSTTAAIGNSGHVVLRANLIHTAGPTCSTGGGAERSLGGNVMAAPCGTASGDDVIAGTFALFASPLALSENGGRTPTLAVDGARVVGGRALATVASCRRGESDQRGAPSAGLPADGPCTPGAVEFNPNPVCGDGFVDRLRLNATATVTPLSPPTLLLSQGEAVAASTSANVDGSAGLEWLVLTDGARLLTVGPTGATEWFSDSGLLGMTLLASGDFTGAPGVDLVVANEASIAAAADVALQSFTFDPLALSVGAITDLAVVNLDGDSFDDLVVADSQGLRVFRGGETGLVTPGVSLANSAQHVRTGDVDGDGRADLLWTAPDPTGDNVFFVLAGADIGTASQPVLGLPAGLTRGVDVVVVNNRRYVASIDSAGDVRFVEFSGGQPVSSTSLFELTTPSSDHDLVAMPGGVVVASATEGTATAFGGLLVPGVGTTAVTNAGFPRLLPVEYDGVLRVGFLRGASGVGVLDFTPAGTQGAEVCDTGTLFGSACAADCRSFVP